jgi:hypothetical protein
MFCELEDLVPKKFAAVSPTSAHRFAILQPRHWTYNGNVVECVLRVGEQRHRLVIPWDKEPKLANAVCGLARLPKNGSCGSPGSCLTFGDSWGSGGALGSGLTFGHS